AGVFDLKRVKSFVKEFLDDKLDVLMIDLGGVAEPGEIIFLARRYKKAFNPRLIIVKNKLLIDFIKSCRIRE
ncbi:MAG: hypothetical protein DRJ31_10510, partial [Candidatus Methanomethylicota archaeon]